MNNYTVLHLHTELSLLDSATNFQDYINRAVELGQKAIAFTEHGNSFLWVSKKLACDEAGLKYIHGVEVYLTEKLLWDDEDGGDPHKVRDNFHTILLAKNMDGLREINALVSRSSTEDHFYYKPRITFDEFLKISDNVIKMSACLASPLNRLPVTHPRYEELVKHYDYLEIQPHNHPDQISFNVHLAELSSKYGIPLVATTDTHSLNQYKAECRTMLQLSKGIEFADEDTFDLTYKSFGELCEMFRAQDALPESLWMQAVENTNVIADSVEPFEVDRKFKYPILYGEKDKEMFLRQVEAGKQAKIECGAIPEEKIPQLEADLQEECAVFEKTNMQGFMLFMGEFITWCKQNGIPVDFGRGSVAGSNVAYVTGITDVNPEVWNTVFSRFVNENRVEAGDIDVDFSPNDREKAYQYIIDRFGEEKTAFILALGTTKAKGCIDEIVRGLKTRWNSQHLTNTKQINAIISVLRNTDVEVVFGDGRCDEEFYFDKRTNKLIFPWMYEGDGRDRLIKRLAKRLSELKQQNEEIAKQNPWTLAYAAKIKETIEVIDAGARQAGDPGSAKYRKAFLESPLYATLEKEYPDVMYYFPGMLDVVISQSMHPAGIVASPVTLRDNYGTLVSDGKELLCLDMDDVHDVGLIKYDLLGLKTVAVVKDTCTLAGISFPKAHEVDWEDEKVWDDMIRSPIGVFQFESAFAFDSLKRYKPRNIFELSLINAALRPSGTSYRDDLINRKHHYNKSKLVEDLLMENNGFLVYQEDVSRFLQLVCGLSGSTADTVRRGIAKKKIDVLEKEMPNILNGYCSKSDQPREAAEQEAKEFLQIIEDASSYMFGKNHSIAYSMLSYICAYLRYYHPAEFITAYLNNADNDEDVANGSELAQLYGIKILPPKFGLSQATYSCRPEEKIIVKGVASVKYMNAQAANELYELSQQVNCRSFMDLLLAMKQTSLKTNQREILTKIDYFADYGNAKELMRMIQVFTFFKNGDAVKVAKSKLSADQIDLLLHFGTDTLKSGATSEKITITDMRGLLGALENIIRELQIPDYTFREKMAIQKENLGYIDLTTNREEDRRKLLIMELYPLRSKSDKSIWGYNAITRSVGTGKVARLTIRSRTFDREPLMEMDVVYASGVTKERSGYWYLNSYQKII